MKTLSAPIGIATLLLALAASLSSPAAAGPLDTVAALSGNTRTGRYAEVQALCAHYQQAYPKQVRCFSFGRSPQGRPMWALLATRTGAFDAASARRRQVPVMLVQGGIHAGEIDGKDAGFLALHEALEDRHPDAPLTRQVLLFVPVFNVDGHERFGAWNRPNQRGPEEMGWRTTAQNRNLNRDYVKADAPEMQAMLRLVDTWDPLAYVDLHVTDGAKFQPDVALMVEPVHVGDAGLRVAGTTLQREVVADVSRHGALALPFYPSFIVDDDPTSGFSDGVPNAWFSHGYFPLRNRLAMLVETHSWKDYPTRVRVTHDVVAALLRQIGLLGSAWLAQARAADGRAAHLGGERLPLTYDVGDTYKTIDFPGYAYTRTMSEVSGALMTHYDETQPQVWHLRLYDDVRPAISVTAPRGGYVVPSEHAAWVSEKLKLHGIEYRLVADALPRADVETFRADGAEFSPTSFEGHQRLEVKGRWKPEQRDLAAGSLFVPIAQPKARLVMEMLEPQALNSFVAWGEFNNAFERKEYMEAYVAEDVARQQMAADPALAEAFRKQVAEDPAFAKDAAARLDFFYRRHASWDERYRLYPVVRTEAVPH